MIKVQTPNNWLQSYTEQCKMKQSTPVVADYSYPQDDAAIVEISTEGSKKAMAYEYKSPSARFEEQMEVKDVPANEGTVITERSMDTLVETVLGGGEVTAQEEQRLNENLPELIRRQYADMQRFRFTDEFDAKEKEEQQKKLEEAMKNNVLMRQQALKDMKQEVEKKKEEAAMQEAEDAQNADAVANKAAEAEMIEDTLDSFQQEISEETQRSIQQEDKEFVKGKVSDARKDSTIPEEQKAAARKKLLRYDAKNKGNLDALTNQRNDESEEQKDYSRMLDDSYQMTMQVFENDDFNIRERTAAYQSFMEDSKELAVNREIAAYQKLYDFQSITDLQIKALSDRGVQTAAKGSDSARRQQQKQTDIRDYMRSIGQEVVEQAARERKTTVTEDASTSKKTTVTEDVSTSKKTTVADKTSTPSDQKLDS